ncbi:Long-chain-alcohol O-fatty-acyltransferase [Bertholletia excelsa]
MGLEAVKREQKAEVERVMKGAEEEEEPLSPAARLFRDPWFDVCIVVVIGCGTKCDTDLIKQGLRRTLINHPRFSSVPVSHGKNNGKMSWVPTNVDLDDHLIIPDLQPDMDSPDQFVEDYVSELTLSPLNPSRPLWELHILDMKTSEAMSTGVFRIHHSLGDGASLISLLLACTRKASDPSAVPTIPRKKRAGLKESGFGLKWFFLTMWSIFTLIWNTFVDMAWFYATILFVEDTKTPLKGGLQVIPKRFVHRTISLNDVKLVKSAMNMTINDVLLGVTQAGLSRYLSRRYASDDGKSEKTKGKKNTLPKRLRFRSALVFNVRPTAGIEALADMMTKESKVRWGNSLGYVLVPFAIGLQEDPLDYLHQAKAIVDRKKHSFEAVCTFNSSTAVLKLLGSKAGAYLAHRVFLNTTLCFSNVVGPEEEITFYGHPVTFIAPSVDGLPQALTIHIQSYGDKMTFALAIDPSVIPDPHQLCDDLEDSFELIKEAALRRGLFKDRLA